MKAILLSLAFAIPILVYSQPSDKFAMFSAQKKSILLRTGITMKYMEMGNPVGLPVIFLHGITDSGRSFQLTMEALAMQNPDLRLIAPDLRGHGETSMPDSVNCRENPETCFEPADFAADIIALMNQLTIPRAHIVGHSMGSVIAQELALRHAGRVNSLVLIGTFVNGKECPAIRQFLLGELIEKNWRTQLEKRSGFRWPSDAWAMTTNDLGEEAATFLQNFWVFDPVAEAAFLQAIMAETANVRLGTWIGAMKALGEMDNRNALKSLKKPSLILWATQDNLVPEQPDQRWVKAAFEMAANANGTAVIYKIYGKTPLPETGMQESDLGHNLHWGAPVEVAADIAAFIKKGKPENGLPYANPHNIKQVVKDESNVGITAWGRKTGSKK